MSKVFNYSYAMNLENAEDPRKVLMQNIPIDLLKDINIIMNVGALITGNRYIPKTKTTRLGKFIVKVRVFGLPGGIGATDL